MSRRPRILLDATAARAPLTGVGWSMFETVAALARHAEGFELIVAAAEPELFAGAVEGRDVAIRIPGGGRGKGRRLQEQVFVPRMAGTMDVDLLHVLTMPGPLTAPCPTVVTVHDLAFRRFPGTVPRLRRWWYRWALPRTLSGAAVVATNSASTAAEVRGAYGLGEDRVVVTPFGTPTWAMETPPADPPGPDAPFLFVGALEPRKNLLTLLDAFASFHAEAVAREPGRPPPRLYVIGAPGWCNEPILERIGHLRERGAVLALSYCDRCALLERLDSARGLLLPSLHEGFGFPILEAMARARPVITSDRGAMREVAGDAALLVDPEDPASIVSALDVLWTDQGRWDDLARRGRERAARWTWEETARSLTALYRRILKPPVFS